MIRYGRRIALIVLRLFPVCLCISATAVHGGRDTIPPALAADANLNDVFFLDGNVGWAVGDRGVIWRTVNGGQDWNRQPFPTSDRLTAVCFRDSQNGWIGTGWTQPYLHTSRGQIWRTDNRGNSWQRSKTDTLPAVRTLFVTDERLGWATTGQSALHDSDLFRSHDGGRVWKATHGGVAKNRADGRTWKDLLTEVNVEDGGVENGPRGLAGEFDWLTMTSQGPDVWIAGDPGTTVLHSSDGGRKWSVGRTGQTLPIRKLRFINELQGWAVGAQGTILATNDGGISWRPQRMVANRVAVLGIYSHATDIDWETLTQLSVQEGYRSQVLLADENVFPDSKGTYPDRDDAPGGETRIEIRAHEAAIIAGSGGATCLSLCGGDDTVFTRRLVRALRTWQPDVIITAGESRSAKQLHAAIVAAIEQAARPAAYSTQLSLAELRPWQVHRAFLREESLAVRGARRVKGPVVATAQLVLPLGQSLADVGTSCRALIDTRYDPPPSMSSYRSLLPGGNSRHIMSGVMSRRGSLSRRPALNTAVGNLRDVSILAQRRRMAELLLTKCVEGGRKPDVLLGQLDELISGMRQGGIAGPGRIPSAEQEAAGDTVFRLSETLAAHDQPVTAQALRRLFLHRFNEHPARDAVVWRQLQSATSAELRLWQADCSADKAQAIPASLGASSATPAGRVVPAALVVDHNNGNDTDIQQLLRAASPLMASRPEVRWALAMAAHKDVTLRIAQQASIDSQWRRRGAAEAWLAKPTTQIPTIVWNCPPRPSPRLDGQLDDETWQFVPRISLHALRPDGEESTGSLAAAYDKRFLYLGVSCPKVAAVAYPTSKQTRQRDTDLSAFDRVAFSIDTNRDSMSAWHLTIDSRGWANDACVTYNGWNPTWHIAVGSTADSWTVEAAIPLEELTTEAITTGAAWAVAVRRHTPEGGTKAWPASVHATATPQSFGLLVFD